MKIHTKFTRNRRAGFYHVYLKTAGLAYSLEWDRRGRLTWYNKGGVVKEGTDELLVLYEKYHGRLLAEVFVPNKDDRVTLFFVKQSKADLLYLVDAAIENNTILAPFDFEKRFAGKCLTPQVWKGSLGNDHFNNKQLLCEKLGMPKENETCSFVLKSPSHAFILD